ncbi:MAG TPA: AMP-dependent synthetase/ligase [Streptosporangiaceae bacterium]|nr:AMP-dependent synthetase/ligase [Streptosporangiaceae bacterium]
MTTEVLAQRALIEESISGMTLCEQFRLTAQQHGTALALSGPNADGTGSQDLTWAQARQRALELAAGFIALGLAPGERVALMMPNQVEHVMADSGAVHAGGVPVTFYSTLAPEQVGFIADDCDARIAVLGGAVEVARWQPVLAQLPRLRKIIVCDAASCPAGELYQSWADFAALGARSYATDPGMVAGRIAAIAPADPAALLYTSGTTGNPKGVLLTHRNILYELAASEANGNLTQGVRWVSYLPLAHIAERMFSIYIPMRLAGEVHFCPDTKQLIKVVGEVRPTAFFGVPRVWEKVQAGIQALLAGEQDPGRRAAVSQAMATGRRYVESCEFGRTTPESLALEFEQANRDVLAPIRSLLGLGEANRVSSAAAPLPPEVAGFFAGLGMKILDVYGMTETTGAFTANSDAEFKLGTVGRPMLGMEVSIAADGEILVRGPLNTPGYLNRPEMTADLIDEQGWLHTGDIGSLDSDGFLRVVDRKKELIITAGGENVPPAVIENLLVVHPLIGQALAYGDRRPYVVALLTLDSDVAPAWAKARGVEADSLAELAASPAVLEAVGEAVAAANDNLARVQQVKRWRLLPVEWTAESEELTPTLKIKRRIVHAKYADDIDALYTG